MNFQTRLSEHFFHRHNWWPIAVLFWAVMHWKFAKGTGIYAPTSNALPALILIAGYFALSPAFFFALAGVDPYAKSRSWGYLVEARWPVYALDHMVNLITLTALYWVLDAPFGWLLFLPITQVFYITFYALRAYARRLGYYREFEK